MADRSCAVCGGPNTRPLSPYCAERCRHRARRGSFGASKPPQPPCCRCGAPIAGKRFGAKWCSDACKFAAAAEEQERKATEDEEYAERRREWSRTSARRWAAANPERAAEKARQWHEANPGYRSAMAKIWREQNPERVQENNRRRHGRGHDALRRARKYGGPHESIDSFRVWFVSCGRCGICGDLVDVDGMHVDHIVSLARGGHHLYSNVQAAHPVCNMRKGART